MEEERTRIKERKEDLELCALTILFPLFHNLLKEYVKEAMKKGTYKEVDYQPMTLIQYDMGSDFEDGTIDEACSVCCLIVVSHPWRKQCFSFTTHRGFFSFLRSSSRCVSNP